MATSVTCKNCGTEDLSWRKSSKGNWYLCEPTQVSTLTHGQFVTIPSAHHCVQALEVRPLAYYFMRREQLEALRRAFPNDWTAADENELDIVIGYCEL